MTSLALRVTRTLIRCYPHAWRARYADEILALVEQTGFGVGRGVDLARGAAREWAREFIRVSGDNSLAMLLVRPALAMVLASAGALVAVWLRMHVATPPVAWLEDGHTVYQSPRLPSLLAFTGPLVTFLLWIRTWRFNSARPRTPRRLGRLIGPREFCAWIAVTAAASALVEWSMLVSDAALPGVTAPSIWFVWSFAAVMALMNVGFVIEATRYPPETPAENLHP